VETRITFEISGEQYTMFVEGFFKKKYYLFRENRDSMFADKISVNVSANTPGEMIRHRLKAKKVVGMVCILSVFSLILLSALYRYGIVKLLIALAVSIALTALICVGVALLCSD